ncbi:MAG: hypothetical protein WEE89_18520 [Gemmatimonadota bacterium]
MRKNANGLEHRTAALTHAQAYGLVLDDSQTDEFVGMYVNQRTLDYGTDGRKTVQLFLDRGHAAGISPYRVIVEWAE